MATQPYTHQQPLIPVDLTTTSEAPQEGVSVPLATPAEQARQQFDLMRASIDNQLANSQDLTFTPTITPAEGTEKYPLFNAYVDNEEAWANRQGAFSSAWNGIVKFGAYTSSTFLQGMMAIPDIIGSATKGSNVYKNDLAIALDEWRENFETTHANFYSKRELDNPFLQWIPFSGGASNFWFDKVLKNTGFMVGAIGSSLVTDAALGAVTGGIGAIPGVAAKVGKAALYINKLLGTTKAIKLETALGSAAATGFKDVYKIQNLAEKAAFTNITNSGRMAAIQIGAAHTEAAVEARSTYNEVKESLISNYKSQNYGSEPNAQELQEIEELATAAGNTTYGINLAILGASNYVQLGSIMRPFNAVKHDLTEGIQTVAGNQASKIKLGVDNVNKVADIDAIKAISEKSVWNTIKTKVAPNILAEGFYEEGGQFATSTGVKNYFESLYDDPTKNEFGDKLNSIIYGLSEQFGSTEGWENMFIGAIIGAGTPVLGTKAREVYDRRQGLLSPQEATQRVVEDLKASSITGLIDLNLDNAITADKRAEQLRNAVEANDVFAFQNLKREAFTDWVLSGVVNGRTDVRIEQLELLKELPAEEFNTFFGIEDSGRQDTIAYIDDLINQTRSIESTYKNLTASLPNPFTYDPKNNKDSTEAYLGFEHYKQALTKISSWQPHIQERRKSISNNLTQINSSLTPELVERVTKRESLNEFVVEYGKEAATLQAQLDSGVVPTLERSSYRRRIKNLNTLAYNIRKFNKSEIFNEEDFVKTSIDVLNFELNSHSESTEQNVPLDRVNDTIIYGVDLNRLNSLRDSAHQAYRNLYSEEGLATFLENYRNWKSGDKVEVPSTEESEAMISIGDVTLELDRLYTKEGSTKKFTLDSDGLRLKAPDGTVIETFTNKEEAAAARDDRNLQLEELETFTVVGKTDTGLFEVIDKNGQVQFLEPSLVEDYIPTQTEEEYVETLTEENNAIVAQQKLEPQYDPIEIDPTFNDRSPVESSKKELGVLFRSTTAPTSITKPYMARAQKFFLNTDSFPESTRKELRIVLVTKSNEGAFGLTGLSDTLLEGTSTDPMDVDSGLVVALFGKVVKGQFRPVDVNGKELGEVTLDTAIYATMPDTKLDWPSSPGELRYQQGPSIEQAKAFAEAWRERRRELFKIKDTGTPLYKFSISAGRAKLTNTERPVTKALITTKELSNQNTIVVATSTTIEHNGQKIKTKPGSVWFRRGSTFVPLNNKTLSKKQVDIVYQGLVELAKYARNNRGKMNPIIFKWLKGILYLRIPSEGLDAKKLIHINEKGFLKLGNLSIPFTEAGIKAHKDSLMEALLDTWTNINDKFVRDNNPYQEVYGFSEDGTPLTQTWESYQHYLLSDTYVLEEGSENDGKARPVTEIPLTTRIAELIPSIESDTNFTGKYAIINASDDGQNLFNIAPLETEVKTVPPQKVEPIEPTEEEDDTTMTITLLGVKVPYTMVDNGDGDLIPTTIPGAALDQLTTKMTSAGVLSKLRRAYLDIGAITEDTDPADIVSFFVASQVNTQAEAQTTPAEEPTEVVPDPQPEAVEVTPEDLPLKGSSTISGKNITYTYRLVDNEVTDLEIHDSPGLNELTETYNTIGAITKFKALIPDLADLDDVSIVKYMTASIVKKDIQTKLVNPVTEDVKTEEVIQKEAPRSEKKVRKRRFKTIPFQPKTVQNVEKEEALIQILLDIPLRRAKTLIKTTNGGFAVGEFFNNLITVYEQAPTGTYAHEAFEAVWAMFVELKERAAIIKEFRSREGSFVDQETGESVSYKNATEHQAKERLADEFGDYLTDRNYYEKPPKQSFLAKLFAELKRLINKYILHKSDIDNLFAKISNGKYKGRRPSPIYQRQYQTIPGISVADTYKIIRGITTELVTELISDRGALVDLDFSSKTGLYGKVWDRLHEDFNSLEFSDTIPSMYQDGQITEEQYVQYMRLWETMLANKAIINQMVADYLKLYAINMYFAPDKSLEDTSHDTDQSPEDREGESSDYAGRTPESYTIDHFKVDVKRGASPAIKLLISTLYEASFVDEFSEEVSAKLDPNTWMTVAVDYSRTFNNLLNELHTANSLSEKMVRLKTLSEEYPEMLVLYNRLRWEDMDKSLSEWGLLAQFHNVFSKQKPNSFYHLVDNNSSVVVDSGLNVASRRLVEAWISGWKLAAQEQDTVIVVKDDIYTFNPSFFDNKPKTLQERLTLLEKLNIDFTEIDYNKLSEKDQREFERRIDRFVNNMNRQEEVVNITASSLNSVGYLNDLTELYLKSKALSESTFYNINGDRQQVFVQNNTISRMINDIVLKSERSELPDFYLTDPYRKDSIYLNRILFDRTGGRTQKQLQIGYHQGVVRSTEDAVTSTDKLSLSNRHFEELNQNLENNWYLLVPADAETEWLISVDPVIDFHDFMTTGIDNRIYTIFKKYYKTEKAISANNPNYKSTLYYLQNGYTEDELSHTMLFKAIDFEVDSLFKLFIDTGKIIQKESEFELKDISTSFISAKGLSQTMSEDMLRMVLKYAVVNDMIAKVEIHKLFFGDVAQFKDPLKRYKSFLSNRETSLHSEQDYTDTLNRELNKVKGFHSLTPNMYGYWHHKDYMLTATVEDIVVSVDSIVEDKQLPKETRDAYAKTNGTDAQGWAFLPAYREIMYRSGHRFSKEQEALYQFVTAQDRLLLAEDGLMPESYKGNTLQKLDRATVESGVSGSATFPVLKPIATGVTRDYKTLLDKYSLAPLSYSLVRGTDAANLFLKMWHQKVSYVIAESGRKVGQSGKDKIYENGEFNMNPFEALVEVPFEIFGIQVETGGNKNAGPLATQLTKLATVNFLDNGTASEEILKKVQRHKEALENLQTEGYQRLLTKLGITDNGDTYSVENKAKTLSILQEELTRTESPYNIKDALGLTEEGDFKSPIEALANYNEIKSILYSMVDKFITKPKMNGGGKVLVSGAMFNRFKVRTTKINNKLAYVSSGLKFYEAKYEGTTRVSVSRMEVLLPMWFRDQIKNHPKYKNKTDDEIFAMLRGSDLLEAIGFRIPTQEMNSVDAIVVVGFLPAWMGDAVVVPEALTTKAGSDFDVDKLNTYLKNVYVTKEGNIKSIPYFGAGAEALQKFKELVEEISYIPTEVEESTDRLESKVLEFYFKSLQNEYFDSIGDLILDPTNFERLVKPNSAAFLKSFADKLIHIAPEEFSVGTTPSVISRTYMTKSRHYFLVGKSGVAIAATSQTNNALNQNQPVYIDIQHADFIMPSPKVGRNIILGDGRIYLPHNTITINDNVVSALSVSKGQDGQYISQKISMYLDGFVDIAKDPWISIIIQNPALISVFLFLEKVGVSSNDIIGFMNQPVIREYIKLLEQRGEDNYLIRPKVISEFVKTPTLLKETTDPAIDVSELYTTIEEFYKGKTLTNTQKEQQYAIFWEFLKYVVMAEHLFIYQRGMSYDTDSAADPIIRYRKEEFTQKARTNSIIVGFDSILSNSFLGNTMELTGRASTGISQGFTLLNRPHIRGILRKVTNNLPDRLSMLKYKKYSKQIEEYLLAYTVQTESLINTRAKELLVNMETSIAQKLRILKTELESDPDSDIYNNPVIRQLIPTAKNRKTDVKALTLLNKHNDAPTIDSIASGFRELKTNPLTMSWYQDLITMFFLQSGFSSSPISLQKYIPYEDFIALTNTSIRNIGNTQSVDLFDSMDAFFRNNWANKDVVPRYTINQTDLLLGTVTNLKHAEPWFAELKRIKENKNGLYNIYKLPMFDAPTNSKFVLLEEEVDTMDVQDGIAKYGTKMRRILLKRAEDLDGKSLSYKDPSTNKIFVLYLPINAWGDGFNAQEFYTTPQVSVYPIDVVKFAEEFSPFEIYNAQAGYFPSETRLSTEQELPQDTVIEGAIQPEQAKEAPTVPIELQEFYNSLTTEQQSKLGNIATIYSEFLQIPIPITLTSYIQNILNCEL